MDNYLSSRQLLKDPVSYSKLLGQGGVEFEMDPPQREYEDSDEFEDCEEYPDPEALVSPWLRSFDELRALMVPIGELIFKRIVREGHMDRDPVPDKARVSLRYSGYWEFEGAPFDSSLMRGKKYEFETGMEMVLEGLEAAVRTMRPYEQAEFIISYKLLFREMGCPPRIKPKADGLFKVEVIDYQLIGDGQAIDDIPKEDRYKFSVVYPKVQDMHLHGKDCVTRSRYRCAVTAFEKAVNSLNYCRLANKEEQHLQTILLLTLAQNLMVCYNKLGKHHRVCIVMKDVRRLTANDPPAKALFHEARALTALGEYDKARKILKKAQVKQPYNKEINEEIGKLDKRIGKYDKASRELWSRAMWGPKSKPLESSGDPVKEAEEQQKQKLEEMIKQFKEAKITSMALARQTYSEPELEVLNDIAKDNNMKLTLSPINENHLTLTKMGN